MVMREVEEDIVDIIHFLRDMKIMTKVAKVKRQHDSLTLQTQFVIRINTAGLSKFSKTMTFKLIRTAFGGKVLRPPIHVEDKHGVTRYVYLGENRTKNISAILASI